MITPCEKEAIFANLRSDNMASMLEMSINDVKKLKKTNPAKAVELLSEAYALA